jgi:membrane associated rhomboid family serine protease
MDTEPREPAEVGAAPVCYRHPDRQTFLACSTCGRPICSECSFDAAVGQRCPECARPQGRARVVNVGQQRTRTPVVTGIIAVTVVAYLIQRSSPSIVLDYAQYNPLVLEGEWWRMLTAAHLHGGFMHIGFNMYALYLFGPSLERRMGSIPFLAMYVASALAGGIAYLYLGGDNLAVGASGAIFGLFGAWIGASFKSRHTPAGAAQFRSLMVLLGINLALPLFVPNVAWQAHVGGLLAGLVIIQAWLRLPPAHAGEWLRTAAAIGVAAVCMVLLFLA